jgi:hypothetical protein
MIFWQASTRSSPINTCRALEVRETMLELILINRIRATRQLRQNVSCVQPWAVWSPNSLD